MTASPRSNGSNARAGVLVFIATIAVGASQWLPPALSGADSGTTIATDQCTATFGTATTSGLARTTLRDQLRSNLDSALAANPVSADVTYSTPTNGAPETTLTPNPTLTYGVAVPSCTIPVPPWSPLDLLSPPTGGVVASVTTTGAMTVATDGTVSYAPT